MPSQALAPVRVFGNGFGGPVRTALTREKAMRRFLEGTGWQNAIARPLARDASFRRYLRLINSSDQSSRILMDAPTDTCGSLDPFIRATNFLGKAGLSAPEIHAADKESGFLLLEDFGDAIVSRIVSDEPDQEAEIYGVAVDLLVELLDFDPGSGFPEYGPDVQSEIATQALWWYQYAMTGNVPAVETGNEFRQIISRTASALGTGKAFIHRDYHAENLIWLPERTGVRRIGLIDHQDSSLGHPTYDLVSILEDARRDVPAELRDSLIHRYALAVGRSEDELLRELAICGAQRNLRIIGVFARLALRDGKLGYIDLIPRVWRHLERDLSHPAVSELKQFALRHLSPPDAALLNRIRCMVS